PLRTRVAGAANRLRTTKEGKAGMTIPGVQVENILNVTATEDGEHVIAVFGLKGGKEKTLAVPISLFQGLIGSFIAAGSDAYRQQLKGLGSDEAMLDVYGVCGITPTGFRMYRGRDPSTNEDLVLLRLIVDDSPIVDVLLGFPQAKQVATGLLAEAEKGPLPPT